LKFTDFRVLFRAQEQHVFEVVSKTLSVVWIVKMADVHCKRSGGLLGVLVFDEQDA
jgi:hypothetical protein